jgi:hypothetical protein
MQLAQVACLRGAISRLLAIIDAVAFEGQLSPSTPDVNSAFDAHC